MVRRVLFLPGASGAAQFWQPVADRLPAGWEKILFDWPGCGAVAADPRVRSFDDLVDLVLAAIDERVQIAAQPTDGAATDERVDIVAQSMGGVVAIRAALARSAAVRGLVLVATSGGLDLSRFDVEDWRPAYRAEYPHAQAFVTDHQQLDLSAQLSTIQAPTLLLWSRGDRISPPEIGRYLASKLPRARLHVLNHDDHAFARDHADEVAPLVEHHLASHADPHPSTQFPMPLTQA